MSGRELKGVIFDLDGVLVNTVDLHFCAWQQLFTELGVPFNEAQKNRIRGVHQRDILTAYVADLSKQQITDYLTRKAGYYRQLLAEAQEDIVYAPAVNLIREAKENGLKIGLASSSIHAQYVIDVVHLKPYFDAVADGNTVLRSKPAPDIFVWVAGALNLHPGEIAVVEDSAAGVEAALTAGMFAVGIDVVSVMPHVNLTMETLSLEAIKLAYNHSLLDNRR